MLFVGGWCASLFCRCVCRYGTAEAEEGALAPARLELWSVFLALQHPQTKQALVFESRSIAPPDLP